MKACYRCWPSYLALFGFHLRFDWSRGVGCSKIIQREGAARPWLCGPGAPRVQCSLMMCQDERCRPLTDPRCGWSGPSIRPWPRHPKRAGVAGAAFPLSPCCSLGGHCLLRKIDARPRGAVNSTYSVLILFNPIHISVSDTWQDVRSHSASREISLWTVGTP